MVELPLSDILIYLLTGLRWTLLLSAIAFLGGGIGALLLLLLRYGWPRFGGWFLHLYVDLFQGTPALMQLFLVFFGLPKLGIDVSPLTAASIALTLYASAFLAEIWRGCVDAVPRGQWDASGALGLSFIMQMRDVILPQALRIAIPPTVGFLTQLVKVTAITSIVGFVELLRSGVIVSNATFQHLLTYGIVAMMYFAICFPLTVCARLLERKLAQSR
jgi:polar amino acid transport system permease protein